MSVVTHIREELDFRQPVTHSIPRWHGTSGPQFCRFSSIYAYMVTGRMPRSGKLPVLNLFTGQKSGFSPRRGDSLHRFRSNFAGLTGTWVRLAVQNFTSIAPGGGGMRPQKYQKFPLFGKESPHRGDSLDRFRKFLGAFILLAILC